MFKPFCLLILGLMCPALLWAGGCGSPPASDPATAAPPPASSSDSDSGDVAAEEPIRLTPVPPPPGVPAVALRPPTGLAAERAAMSLQEVVAGITPPPHLVDPTPGATGSPDAPGSSDSLDPDLAPPLAAQKFYAAGHQSLLSGDNFGAVQAFEKALRLSPDHPQILRSLGEAWMRAGNRVSAANSYREAHAADPTDLSSLFMLGRFALEDRRLDDAILHLYHALQLAEQDQAADPAARRLVSFYFANTLNQTGYATAAAELFDRYFDQDGQPMPPPSRLARELAMIDSQQGETLVLVGDLHHRLEDPETAATAYRLADRLGVLNPDSLQLRMLYTRLRLGQTHAAQRILTRLVTAPGDDTPDHEPASTDTRTLELIRYAVAQGLPAEELIRNLQAMYEQQDRPTALALAVADVMPPEQATLFLRQHLERRPGDAEVFGRLISLLLIETADAEEYRQAIDMTAAAMAGSPDQAPRYADQLLANTTDLHALAAAFPPLDSDPQAAATVGGSAETGVAAEPVDQVTADDDATAEGQGLAAVAEDPEATQERRVRAMLRVLHGRVLRQIEQSDAARAALRRAIELDGQQLLARLELAELEAEAGRAAEAASILDQLPEAAARSPRVTQLRIRLLIETGREAEALEAIEQALRLSPPGNPLMLTKADLLLKQGDTAAAERVLLDALNARPTEETIYEKLLEIYESDGSMMRNYQRLRRRMVETIPEARITRLVRAQTLVAMRRYPEAEQLLAGLEMPADGDGDDRHRVEVQRMRMEVFVGTQQGERVGELLERHLAEAGDNPDDEILAAAARFYQRSGDQARYFEIEEVRWKHRPPGVDRSAVLAQVYFNQERYRDAISMVQEVFELAGPEEVRVLTFAGGIWAQSLVKLEDDAGALELLTRMNREQPKLGQELTRQLAIVYQVEGRPEQSRQILRLGLEHFPRDPNLNNQLGYSLGNEGVELPAARRMLTIALQEEPDNAAYLDSMGWILYKSADFDGALDWLEKSMNADPTGNPVILDHLGDTLYRLGREAEAVRHWDQARAKLSEPDYQLFDPEEEGLIDRVTLKIEAVAEGREVPVAALGEGVELPAVDDAAAEQADPAAAVPQTPPPPPAPAPPVPVPPAPAGLPPAPTSPQAPAVPADDAS